MGGMGSGTPMPVRATLQYRALLPPTPIYEPAAPNTFAHFLLERYVAFTQHGSFRRLFQVSHQPWPQIPIDAEIESATLLQTTGRWCPHAHFDSANFSPGVRDVQMGWPKRID